MGTKAMLIAGLALLGGLLPATAGARESFDTTIDYLGSQDIDNEDILYGTIDSVKKCRGERKMRLLIDEGSGFEVADSGRSSANGSWALQGDFTEASGGAKVKALPTKLPNGDVCKRASIQIPT